MKKNTIREKPQQEPLQNDHVSIADSVDESTYGITAKGDICKMCVRYGGSMFCAHNHKEIKSLSEMQGDIALLERDIAGSADRGEKGGITTTNSKQKKKKNPFEARISQTAFIPAASAGMRTRSHERQKSLGMRTRSQERNRQQQDPFHAKIPTTAFTPSLSKRKDTTDLCQMMNGLGL